MATMTETQKEDRDQLTLDLVRDYQLGPGLAHLIATMQARIQALEARLDAEETYRQEQNER